MNGRLKVKGLGALFIVDYASEMNIIRAPIVARSACFHDHLIHRRGAVEKCIQAGLLANPATVTLAVPFSNVTSTSLLSSCPS